MITTAKTKALRKKEATLFEKNRIKMKTAAAITAGSVYF